MLFTLLFSSMCSFRFHKASKLFIYGFNKEKFLDIHALQRLKMLFRDLIVQNLPGEHTLATALRVDLKQQYPREIAPLNN